MFINKSGIFSVENIANFLKASESKASVLMTKPQIFEGNACSLKYTGDIIKFSKPKGLDKSGEACKFFGVDSIDNLTEKKENHRKLSEIMEKKYRGIFSGGTTDLESFEHDFFEFCKYDRKTKTSYSPCYNYVKPAFSIGKNNHGAKVTFLGFDFQGNSWLHSIGFIQDYSGKLFILDSLGNETRELQKFHKKLGEIILKRTRNTDNEIYKVICNSKPQQGADELTCNNWTFANLEAVKQAIKKGTIHSVEELEVILPRDINKILEQQMNLVKTFNN